MLRNRVDKATALDTPENMDGYDIAADIAAGFVPIVGTAQAARDFERARRDDDGWGMALSGLGLIPFAGGFTKLTNALRKGMTVKDPIRKEFPGIYKRPDEIAKEAAAMVAPENPMLKELWGVNRSDMSDLALNRAQTMEPVIPGAAKNPKGAASASAIITPRNAGRLVDTLGEASRHGELYRGMTGWYYMDPVYQRMVDLMGEDAAKDAYQRFNTFTGIASANSPVSTEVNRGTAAYMLHNKNRFADFLRYGGKRSSDRPADFFNVPGHMGHKTSHGVPMSRFAESGALQMQSPKVPLYIQASGATPIGVQNQVPVGDAHFSRAIGLADVRTNKDFGASVSTPELQAISPWWKRKIADPIGVNPVSAQALAWGTFAPQTGVDTLVGAPKLELLTNEIEKTAARLGVTPQTARDMVLMGETYAGR